MTTMTDAQAAEAIRAHHFELATGLRQRGGALLAAARAGEPHAGARDALLEYLDTEIIPHARAEEQAMYPAGDAGATAMLVRSMRDEHLALMALVEELRAETDAIPAVAAASALMALFDSHLHKENDLLVPALVEAPDVSLAALLGGMHELLG